MNDSHIETLLAERAEYVKHHKPKRVEQVDIELAKYDAVPTAKKKKG